MKEQIRSKAGQMILVMAKDGKVVHWKMKRPVTVFLLWMAGLILHAATIRGADTVTLSGTTALYGEDGVRFKAFAEKGTVVEVGPVVTNKGMVRVSLPKEKASYLCWPSDVGKTLDVPFLKGKITRMTVPGTNNTQYLLYIPTNYSPDKPCPMILCLTRSSNHMAMLKTMRFACEKYGWIGVGRKKYALGEKTYPRDLEAIHEVLDDVRRRVPHNRRREYITGHLSSGCYVYQMARFNWNQFAGAAVFSGGMGQRYFGSQLIYPERMAVAQGQGSEDSAALYWSTENRKLLSDSGARCRNFLYSGNRSRHPPQETVDEVFQWFEEDWKEKGASLSADPTDAAITDRAQKAWVAYQSNRKAESANLCLALFLAANYSPLAEGIETLFADILGDKGKTERITLTCPKPFRDTAYLILWEKADRYQRRKNMQKLLAFAEATFAVKPQGRAIPDEQRHDWARWLYVERAMAFTARGEYDRADFELRRAIESNRKNISPYLHLGDVHYLRGRYAKALAQYKHALKLNPEDKWVLSSQGEVYQVMAEYDKAMASFSKVVNKHRDSAKGYYYRGVTYFWKRELDKAINEFRVALTKKGPDREYAAIWLHIAKAMKEGKDNDELTFYINTHLDAEGKLAVLRDLFLKKASPQDAVTRVGALPDVSLEDRCEIHYYAGIYYLLQGQKDKAKGYFQQSLALKSYASKNSEHELRLMGALKERPRVQAIVNAGKKPRVALYGSGGEEAAALVALIEMQLLGEDSITLLDREHINKVIRENSIAGEGLMSVESVLKLGPLLNCDLIAELRFVKTRDGQMTRTMVMFDALTGARLTDSMLVGGTGDRETLAKKGESILIMGTGKWQGREGQKGLKTLSLMSVRDVGLPGSMKHLSKDIGDLLERAFLSMPGVAILERKRLEYVNTEARVGVDRRERLLSSCILLDLDVSRGENNSSVVVRAALSDKDGKELSSVTSKGQASAIGALVMGLAEKIGSKMMNMAVQPDPEFLEQEAERFMAWGNDPEKTGVALALAEGALALDKSSRENYSRVINLLLRQSKENRKDIERNMDLLERALDLCAKNNLKKAGIGQINTTPFVSNFIMLDNQEATRRYPERMKWLRQKFFKLYVDACRNGVEWLREDVLRQGSSDPNELAEAYIATFGKTIRFPLFDVSGPVGLKMLSGLVRIKNSPEKGKKKTVSPPFSPHVAKKLYAFYRNLAGSGLLEDRLELNFAALCLVDLYPRHFKDAPELKKRHLRAAADIVAKSPRMATPFVYLLYHGRPWSKISNMTKRLVHRVGLPPVPEHELIFPREFIVPEVRRVASMLNDEKKTCTGLYSLLDWYDLENADHPGAYLEEAASLLNMQKSGDQNELSDVIRTHRARYGEGAKFAVRGLARKETRYSFEFRKKTTLYSVPQERGRSRIMSADLIDDQLYLLLGKDMVYHTPADGKRAYDPKTYEIIRLKPGSAEFTSEAKWFPDRKLWQSNLPPRVTGRMKITSDEFLVPTVKGLLCIPRKEGAHHVVGPPLLPAPQVQACARVGSRLYIACSDKAGSHIVRCSLDGSSLRILASSARRETLSILDDCKSYTVNSILRDSLRNRLILVLGTRIFSCSIKTDKITQIWLAKEKWPRGLKTIRPMPGDRFLVGNSSIRGENRTYVHSWDPEVPFAIWAPGKNQVDLLISKSSKARFRQSIGGDVEAIAVIGDRAYYTQFGKKWVVLENSSKGKLEADLALLDNEAPFFLRPDGQKLLAVTRNHVLVLDSEGCAVKTTTSELDIPATTTAPEETQTDLVQPMTGQEKVKARAKSGRVTIKYHKEGTVRLNGSSPSQLSPNKPRSWGFLRPGKHKIVVKSWGKEWSKEFELKAGEKKVIEAFGE